MFDTFRGGREVLPEFRTQGLWRRVKAAKKSRPLPFRLIESIGIIFAAVLAYLAIGELALRVAMRAPLTDWYDFRHERAAGTINKAVEYDSVLGWRLKSHIKSQGFNTLDYGFRSNGEADAKVHMGGVLAVGSSFTAGSEVIDEESLAGTFAAAHWPQREQWRSGRLSGRSDRTVGRATITAPASAGHRGRSHPRHHHRYGLRIIGLGKAIFYSRKRGTSDSQFSGAAKRSGRIQIELGIKSYLGHFALVDQFMAAFFPNFWFTADGSSFFTVETDEIGVACHLLGRLKHKTDAANVRLLLYLQYGGLEVVDSTRMAAASGSGIYYRAKRWIKTKLSPLLLNTPPGAPNWYEAAQETGKCARALGIKTVDELPVLRAVYDRNPDNLRKYYQIEPDGSMGHKSSFGNREVAKLVAAAMSELQPPADRKPSR